MHYVLVQHHARGPTAMGCMCTFRHPPKQHRPCPCRLLGDRRLPVMLSDACCYHTLLATAITSWVDIGVTNFWCPYSIQSSRCKETQIHAWTLALQTSDVLRVYRVCNVKSYKFMDGHWRCKLPASLEQTSRLLGVYRAYNVKKNKVMGGRWRYKLLVSLEFTITM